MQRREKGKKEEITGGLNQIPQAIHTVGEHCLFPVLAGHTTEYLTLQ